MSAERRESGDTQRAACHASPAVGLSRVGGATPGSHLSAFVAAQEIA